MVQLTDIQLVLLNAASQREDGIIPDDGLHGLRDAGGEFDR